MSDRYATAEEFLAAHTEFKDDIDTLEAVAMAAEEPTTPKKPDKEWVETQKARSEYLKEWEEDMRYAVELANEGM
jgi:hypothetical protein